MSEAIKQGGAHVHPEILAAFLDGNLRDAERSRVVEHLAACDDCYEAFSDSAHLVEALAEEDEEELDGEPSHHVEPGILRPQRSRWRRMVVWAPLAAAATLILLLLPWRGPGSLPVDELTLGLASRDIQPSLAATAGSRWPAERSGEISLSDPEKVAFRLGVRAVDLELALATGNGELAHSLAAEIDELLAKIPLSQPVEVSYAGNEGIKDRIERGDSPRQLLPLHHRADRLLGPDPDSGEPGFTDPFWYRFGKWAGAAQLAAATGNGAWFEETGSRRLLRRFRRQELPPEIAGELDRLGQQLAAPPAERDLARIDALLRNIIRTAAGGA